MAMAAQDTFVARLDNGTEQTVQKGQPFPNNHELVRRDAAAQRANPDRIPLFRPLDLGDEEPPKSPPAQDETSAVRTGPAKPGPDTAGASRAASPKASAPRGAGRPAVKGA